MIDGVIEIEGLLWVGGSGAVGRGLGVFCSGELDRGAMERSGNEKSTGVVCTGLE